MRSGTVAFLGPNGSNRHVLRQMVVVAVQLMLLLAIGAWQPGGMQLGTDVVVVLVLILAHLAW
jgi:hypothetical protein